MATVSQDTANTANTANKVETEKKYGWWSDKQLMQTKKCHMYKTPVDDNLVNVTSVTKSAEHHGTSYDDIRLVGEITEWQCLNRKTIWELLDNKCVDNSTMYMETAATLMPLMKPPPKPPIKPPIKPPTVPITE